MLASGLGQGGGGGGGGAAFLTQDNNLNNLYRGPLGKAMYQISKAWAFCFQTRRFLMFFPMWVYVKQVTQGYNLNNLSRSIR